jgi:DNA-binding transcriptional ArsR family regulator
MNNLLSTLPALSENGTLLNLNLLGSKKAAMILRAINHSLRQQILRLIDENGKMTVTEIYIQLRLEQSVASQHLAILRKAGFVKTDRDGKFIYYSVNSRRFDELNRFIEDLLK